MNWIRNAIIDRLRSIEGNTEAIPEVWANQTRYNNLTPAYLRDHLLLEIKEMQRELQSMRKILQVFSEEFE